MEGQGRRDGEIQGERGAVASLHGLLGYAEESVPYHTGRGRFAGV